jgi:hypothetical protein
VTGRSVSIPVPDHPRRGCSSKNPGAIPTDTSRVSSPHDCRLTVPERILLFCVASGTEWAQAGITGATVTMMLAASSSATGFGLAGYT